MECGESADPHDENAGNCGARTGAGSAERILETFVSLQRHLLRKDGELAQRFDPDLTPLHRKLLGLAGVSTAAFANC